MSADQGEYFDMLERTAELGYENQGLREHVQELQREIARVRSQNDTLRSRLARLVRDATELIGEHDHEDDR